MAGASDKQIKITKDKLTKRFATEQEQTQPDRSQVSFEPNESKPVVKMTWDTVDGLQPRIYVNIGGTVPSGKRYRIARADIGLEINKPFNLTTEETIAVLADMIGLKWEQLIAAQADRILETL